MSFQSLWVLVLTYSCLFLTHEAFAQDNGGDGNGVSTTTVQPPQVALCNESSSMTIDAEEFSGVWWEVARYPAPRNFLCVEVNFTVLPDNEINIATTYCNTPTYPWVNQTMTTNITLDSSTEDNVGYNISYENGLTNTSYVVFKLLATDYNNYAFICGYSDATDNSTAFGLVLTRDRQPAANVLNGYINQASKSYANFDNNSMTLITQDSSCWGVLPASGTWKLQISLLTFSFVMFAAFLSHI